MSSAARDFNLHAIHYISKEFDAAVQATAANFEIGTIPSGALLVAGVSGAYITVDFNGTTNTYSIGFAADSVSSANSTAYGSAVALATTSAYFAAAAINATSVLGKPVAVDRTVTAQWAGTATTGKARIVVGYMPNR